MSQILEIDSVMLEFGAKRVLQDVYLKSETGRITGLLGRNGTGKTCLMDIIYGKLIPNDSSVRLNEKALLRSSRNPSDIMYLPQFRFIPNTLSLNRIFEDFNLDFSEFILVFPEFEKYIKSKLRELSGGEQRIVEIYLIITSETKFCLLDEPFSHVMPLHINRIKNLILREKKNKGIVITDHLYKHITDICDELYVLKEGKTHLTNNINELETLGYLKTD